MFKKIQQFFAHHHSERQRAQLLKPNYGFLFDPPPSDEWVSLDLEMTGLNPKTDYILSVGAVRIYRDNSGFRIDTGQALSLVCRPPVMPSRESIIIHGLRPSDVENGMAYEGMLAELLEFIGSRPIVGFAIDRDMAFLNALIKPWLGVALPNRLLDVSRLEQDVRQQRSRQREVAVAPKHLNQLLDDYTIPRLPAHDAVNDAVMTAMVFCHVIKSSVQ